MQAGDLSLDVAEAQQRAVDILDQLVRFPTLSGETNLDMIAFVTRYLADHGVVSSISHDESGLRANLYATIGPEIDGGVLLNGHTDVVPVEGQEWSSDPFELRIVDDRLYGRGSVDMKGFLACMLAMTPEFKAMPLARPVHLSMCYDEENGGFGAPVLAGDIVSKTWRPSVAIVGEPTEMRMVGAHKGGLELRTEVTGFAAHACDPSKGVNAIMIAADMIAHLRKLAHDLSGRIDSESPCDPPHVTINVGTVHGGAARNVVAGDCAFDWEIRPTRSGQAETLLEEINNHFTTSLTPVGASFQTTVEAVVPPLMYDPQSAAAQLVGKLTGMNSVGAVSFGTDAGHFQANGMSTIVFGPGSIDQAHKPDEFIELEQIRQCLRFLHKLGGELSA